MIDELKIAADEILTLVQGTFEFGTHLKGYIADLVDECLIDVLECGVHAQDLVVLHDALPRHRCNSHNKIKNLCVKETRFQSYID